MPFQSAHRYYFHCTNHTYMYIPGSTIVSVFILGWLCWARYATPNRTIECARRLYFSFTSPFKMQRIIESFVFGCICRRKMLLCVHFLFTFTIYCCSKSRKEMDGNECRVRATPGQLSQRANRSPSSSIYYHFWLEPLFFFFSPE